MLPPASNSSYYAREAKVCQRLYPFDYNSLILIEYSPFRINLQHSFGQESVEELQEVLQGSMHRLLAEEMHDLVSAACSA